MMIVVVASIAVSAVAAVVSGAFSFFVAIVAAGDASVELLAVRFFRRHPR